MVFHGALVMIVITVGGDSVTNQPTSGNDSPKAKESAGRILELARKYEFFADAERHTKFQLHDKPVLTHSNPVRGDVYGNVFLWTRDGRPEVVGAVFDFRTEKRIDSEFHTFSHGGIVAFRDTRVIWNPRNAGVEFHPVAGAPAPVTTAGTRLIQMRSLAREFTVERNHPESKREFVRLLPQPIYRYSSRGANVIDGAVFVFVEGTDPETFLLLEASGGERPAWRFALARMNLVEFWGYHNGEVIWHVDHVDWSDVFDKQDPYAIVREQPPRGFVRSR